ncbi:MAG: hypothetical protein AAF960_18905, partial [Bacteroidota bacterium]
KGLKEAEEVLKVANMEDEERREYQRFGEVLSDRASQALSIKVEIEMAVEKERRAKELAVRKEQEKAITAMIKNTNLSDEEIANALSVDVERVNKIRNEIK